MLQNKNQQVLLRTVNSYVIGFNRPLIYIKAGFQTKTASPWNIFTYDLSHSLLNKNSLSSIINTFWGDIMSNLDNDQFIAVFITVEYTNHQLKSLACPSGPTGHPCPRASLDKGMNESGLLLNLIKMI